MEDRVLAIVDAFVAELGATPVRGHVAPEDTLDRDLGIGSLERVELLFRIEQAFTRRFPDSALAEIDRVRDLVTVVRAGAAPGAERVAGTAPASSADVSVPAFGAGVPAPAAAPTLVAVLRWHAETHPDRVHAVLALDDGDERRITYGELWTEARRVAGGLRAQGVERGAAVAIMLRTEPAFLSVFFGVLLAGAVPVPVYPPVRADRLEEYATRQVKILDNAQARILIGFREVERLAALLRPRVPSLATVTTPERLAASLPGAPAALVADDPALIQYTSGSTGDPKGVLLTHANLLANIRALGEAIGLGADDVCVSWLPLYHDMGLIGMWLGSLYHGVPVVILSPSAFLARPARWLRAISTHRATISAAPNFAFDLCVRQIPDAELAGLDLSSWRLAFNGSEAVRVETIERFTRRFAPHGFRAAAMCPGYGLAEASVGLTVSTPGAGARVDRVSRERFQRTRRAEPAPAGEPAPLAFVSSGTALPGHEVRVVDADGAPLPDRVEGRVEFRGPSVTAGYFRNPEATARLVHRGFMDSGDLGYRADGQLYITGRSKDLVIKAGRNLHPQEIEEPVGDVPGIRRGAVAAFGVGDPALGTERLVVVAETQAREAAALARLQVAVRDRVVAALGLPPDVVALVPPDSVLKTPSGKIRRSATREAWMQGTLVRRASPRVERLRLAAAALHARLGALRDLARRLGSGLRAGLLLLIMAPPLWLAVHLLPAPALDRAVRRWCRALLTLAGCRTRVEGVERLPARGAVVFAVNHASYLDAVAVLATIPREFRFVAKRELRAWPLVGGVIDAVGHLTVERTDLSRSVDDARRATEVLRHGTSLVFFPEGTFRERPGLLPFRLGAFKAAVDAGCPVVPVTVRGTRAVLPAGAWLPRHGPITVVIGAPIAPAGAGWREMVRLRDRARAEISRGTGEPAA